MKRCCEEQQEIGPVQVGIVFKDEINSAGSDTRHVCRTVDHFLDNIRSGSKPSFSPTISWFHWRQDHECKISNRSLLSTSLLNFRPPKPLPDSMWPAQSGRLHHSSVALKCYQCGFSRMHISSRAIHYKTVQLVTCRWKSGNMPLSLHNSKRPTWMSLAWPVTDLYRIYHTSQRFLRELPTVGWSASLKTVNFCQTFSQLIDEVIQPRQQFLRSIWISSTPSQIVNLLCCLLWTWQQHSTRSTTTSCCSVLRQHLGSEKLYAVATLLYWGQYTVSPSNWSIDYSSAGTVWSVSRLGVGSAAVYTLNGRHQ